VFASTEYAPIASERSEPDGAWSSMESLVAELKLIAPIFVCDDTLFTFERVKLVLPSIAAVCGIVSRLRSIDEPGPGTAGTLPPPLPSEFNPLPKKFHQLAAGGGGAGGMLGTEAAGGAGAAEGTEADGGEAGVEGAGAAGGAGADVELFC
jgi:hypothetical protein